MTKRIAVIQDLSCIGRCSLAVAMSVIPVLGVETAVLPTAILSGHTAFSTYSFVDFTKEAEKIIDQWKAQDFRFDAIYIGYLGSNDLIRMTRRFIHTFRGADTFVILDPAFGDNGKLYTGFDMRYVEELRQLCGEADVILPNVTEACFLLGENYSDDISCSKRLLENANNLLVGRLKNVLITSCRFNEHEISLSCTGDTPFIYSHERLSVSMHGTGDLFASVFSGLVTRGQDIEQAARIAADFTCDCIAHSMKKEDRRWYGVDYEDMLGELIRRTR